MPRITINEIANRAGVSKGAVSYALNGRPGVSEETRERILHIARAAGWVPNRTARLLSGSRTDTLGLVLARPAETLSSEPFYMEFVAGIQTELETRSFGLLLQLATDTGHEIEIYRRWKQESRVDGVIVVDPVADDPRIPVLRELGFAAVVVVDGGGGVGEFTTVWTDNVAGMRAAVIHLAGLGHRAIARVAGIPRLNHVARRDSAYLEAIRDVGGQGTIVHTDFSAEAGAEAVRDLMARPDRPTAIIFDNDLMAVAGLFELSTLGVSVPDEVSLLAWDDSRLCRITHPALSAMSLDVVALGSHVARRVFGLLNGEPPAPHYDSTPRLVERSSTAPPPTADR